MRLELPKIEGQRRNQNEKELAQLAGCNQLCGPVCRPECPWVSSHLCTPSCPHAPLALTSDSAFPIEDGILPLVFELKASRAYEPVWSCEGHYGHDQRLRRLPSVWFCCESLPQTRALAEVVSDLCFETRSSARWGISLCCPDNPSRNTIFKIAPEAAPGARLEPLRKDIAMLARNLRDRLSKKGGKLHFQLSSGP